MHRGMNQAVVFGGAVQAGQVQGVEPAEVEHQRSRRRGYNRGRGAVQHAQQHAPRPAGQRAQRQGDGRGQGQQRRAGHAEQQMLQDMNREDVVVAGHRRQHGGRRHTGYRPADAGPAPEQGARRMGRAPGGLEPDPPTASVVERLFA